MTATLVLAVSQLIPAVVSGAAALSNHLTNHFHVALGFVLVLDIFRNAIKNNNDPSLAEYRPHCETIASFCHFMAAENPQFLPKETFR